MDMDAFAIAMRNLIDDAVNHGARMGRIDVQVTPGGVIRIINEGPIVPPDTLTNLKERFVRWQSRSGGSGLGLAIVEEHRAQEIVFENKVMKQSCRGMHAREPHDRVARQFVQTQY
jgi:signal transduction histidine kinase